MVVVLDGGGNVEKLSMSTEKSHNVTLGNAITNRDYRENQPDRQQTCYFYL